MLERAFSFLGADGVGLAKKVDEIWGSLILMVVTNFVLLLCNKNHEGVSEF